MIVHFNIGKLKGVFVQTPYIYKNFKLVQYTKAGTYVIETDSKRLNHWKTNVPRGDYEIIGHSHNLRPELVEEKLKIPFNQYIKLLNEKEITVNYSDRSDFWLVLISCNALNKKK